MKPDDHTLIYELSDDALETVVSIEQVPTILNASYCLTCPSWESEEEQAFRAVTTLGSSSAAAPPSSEYAKGAMLESSENGESCHSSDLIRSNALPLINSTGASLMMRWRLRRICITFGETTPLA